MNPDPASSTPGDDKVEEQGVSIEAGGILRRIGASGPEVAIVRAEGGDWTLPKGAAEGAQQRFEDAAIQRVREQTLCEPRITGWAGATHKLTGSGPRVVMFWTMEAVRVADGKSDKVLWLPPDKALARLDLPDEGDLLADALRTRPRKGRVARFWMRRDAKLRRLEAYLVAAGPQLERRITAWMGSSSSLRTESDSWVVEVRSHLRRSAEAVADGDVDRGWMSLAAAERTAFHGIDDPAELRDRNVVLANEASRKLREWRKESVAALTKENEELLEPAKAKGDTGCTDQKLDPKGMDTARSRTVRAQEIFDGHSQNVYYMIRVLGGQIRIALMSLVALLIITGGLLAWGLVRVDKKVTEEAAAGVLVISVLLGMTGASMSVVQSLMARRRDPNVPEAVASTWTTVTRPVVGGASALATFLVFSAGVVSLGNSNVAALLAIAFFSGFTERYVIGVLRSATTSPS